MRSLCSALMPICLLLPVAAWAAGLPQMVEGQPMPSLAPMLERVTPGVVNIATRTERAGQESPLLRDPFFRFFFDLPRPRPREGQSLGSGVIIDAARGLIITNVHVIKGASEIEVTLRDGRRLQADLVGVDPESDVAVIRVPAHDLTALPLADSEQIKVGDFVVAIGNPFGLGQTVTSGIVSALGRSGLGIEGYEDFIQTDASINPGNSGGALVNLRGELVGINTAILAPGGGNIGIGFAIPVNMARDIVDQLVATGEVRRGRLGVVAQDLTADLADAFGVPPTTSGAVVVEVSTGSTGAAAGLMPGDIIVAANGRPVRRAADVRNVVGLARVGQDIEVEVLRDGQRRTLSATVAEPTAAASSIDLDGVGQRLGGASFSDIVPGMPLHGRISGVLVTEVVRGSPAAFAGLLPGDVVTSVNRRRVTGVDGLLTALAESGAGLLLGVQRGNTSLFVLVR